MSSDNSYHEGITESDIKTLVSTFEDTIDEYRQMIAGLVPLPEKFEARYQNGGRVIVKGNVHGKIFRYPIDETRLIDPDVFKQFRQLHNGIWKDYALVSQSLDMISVLDLETGEIIGKIVADGDVVDFHVDRLTDMRAKFKTSEDLDALSKLATDFAPEGSSFKAWLTAPAFRERIEKELESLHEDLYRASARFGNAAFFSYRTGPKRPAGIVEGKRRFLGKLDLSNISDGEMKLVDLPTIELDVYGPRVSDLVSLAEDSNAYVIREQTTRWI